MVMQPGFPAYHYGTQPFSWSLASPTNSHFVQLGWAPQSTQNVPTQAAAPVATRPQYRPLSYRTAICRHYIKNGGWCPLGNECAYIHNEELARYANDDVRFPGGRPAGSHTRAGSKQSHCWAYIQGLCRVRDCPYLHPVAVHMFQPHTPCLAWPNCAKGAFCNFKHPEPLISQPARPAESSPIQANHQSQSPPMAFNPPGTVQVRGTTYFQVAPPPPPPAITHSGLAAPPTYSQPMAQQPSPQYSYSLSYSPLAPSVPSGYSPYSPASIPFLSPVYEARPSLPPVSVAPMTAPPPEDPHRFTAGGSSGALDTQILTPEVRSSTAPSVARSEGIEEFPYKPPAQQRLGHTRRYSVSTKSKEDSDALGLATQSARREPWMTHSKRDGETHKSWPWAPESLINAQNSHKTQFAF
ncbi:hypothetical protein K474DRAFT_1037501 [Panus rudis PR-1116 ss-1]|nr:hypothetical protein K474DRAFT_1037501 [Panus rudis PR-1116 ss-1]